MRAMPSRQPNKSSAKLPQKTPHPSVSDFGKADKLIAKDVQQRLSGQGEAIQERIVAANRRTTQSLRLQHKAPNGIGWKASSHRDDHLPLTSH